MAHTDERKIWNFTVPKLLTCWSRTVCPYFPWLYYWYLCYQYDSLSVFPLTSPIRLFRSFPWLHYWPQRYQYDCLSIFPLTSLLISALSIQLFIHLSPDFTIDPSVINTTLYPSFPDFIINTWVSNNAILLTLDMNRTLSCCYALLTLSLAMPTTIIVYFFHLPLYNMDMWWALVRAVMNFWFT